MHPHLTSPLDSFLSRKHSYKNVGYIIQLERQFIILILYRFISLI